MPLFIIFVFSIVILGTVEFTICFYVSKNITTIINSTVLLAITITGFLALFLALIFTTLYFTF